MELSGQHQYPAALLKEKNRGAHLLGGWVGRTVGLGDLGYR